jgi:hypothetical protein
LANCCIEGKLKGGRLVAVKKLMLIFPDSFVGALYIGGDVWPDGGLIPIGVASTGCCGVCSFPSSKNLLIPPIVYLYKDQ